MPSSPKFKWSRPVTNPHGVLVRTSKCGRAHIAKYGLPGASWNEYVPLLDGVPLPKYYRLGDAKKALEAAECGETPPVVVRPKWMHEYEVREPSADAETNYRRTTQWFREHVLGRTGRREEQRPNPYVVLGLDETADLQACLSAARNLKKKYHPDRGKERGANRDKFEAVVAAITEIEELHA